MIPVVLMFLIPKLILLFPIPLFGAAFLIYNQDAKVNGMGMAAISSVDNPSSVFYNPSLMLNKKGVGFSAGETMIHPEILYKDPLTGKRFHTKSKTYHIPYFYGKYGEENFSFGVGLFSPFGLSTEWPDKWAGRYITKLAEIKSTYINPVFAYRVNEYLSIGGGFSYITSSVKMKNGVNLSLMGLGDGEMRLKGDGEGIGLNGAATLYLPNQYRLSLTYRSPSRIIYRGKANLFLPPPLTSSSTKARSSFTFPFLFSIGVAKSAGPLTMEANLLYTGWSSMSSYRITSEDGTANALLRKGWFNTPSFAFGVNYGVKKAFEIRGGYMLDKSPVPKRSMGPELPDSNRHIFTTGGGFKHGPWYMDIGYQLTLFEGKRSNLQELKGSYRGIASVGFLSIGYNL
ncbi:MAG: outer membrane protein transport protein [Syntrophorhabdaceae bacterium]|nr:outer membrane protein transport protein [Syntrophorhabdaceae bacterium]